MALRFLPVIVLLFRRFGGRIAGMGEVVTRGGRRFVEIGRVSELENDELDAARIMAGGKSYRSFSHQPSLSLTIFFLTLAAVEVTRG